MLAYLKMLRFQTFCHFLLGLFIFGDGGDLTAKKLGEQCFYDQTCFENDINSLCIQRGKYKNV